MSDRARQLLRHTVATVAYRGGKALRGAPESFAQYGAPDKPAVKIVAHLGDLFDWALNMARGTPAWNDSEPLPWDEEVARFHKTLAAFDEYLVSEQPLKEPIERLFQGPVADALTHVGQLAMMRRLAGCPIKGENYFVADIVTGRVGAQQAAPKREF
jgi:hypothetical protein